MVGNLKVKNCLKWKQYIYIYIYIIYNIYNIYNVYIYIYTYIYILAILPNFPCLTFLFIAMHTCANKHKPCTKSNLSDMQSYVRELFLLYVLLMIKTLTGQSYVKLCSVLLLFLTSKRRMWVFDINIFWTIS